MGDVLAFRLSSITFPTTAIGPVRAVIYPVDAAEPTRTAAGTKDDRTVPVAWAAELGSRHGLA